MHLSETFRKLNIAKPDPAAEQLAKNHWNAIAKPLHGLGDFEDAVIRIAAIQGREVPELDKRALVVMCADNGIVEEGISQSGHEVTRQVAALLGQGKSSVCQMAAEVRCDVIPIDVGMHPGVPEILPGVLDHKVCQGTENFLKKPAMTPEQVIQAIEIGRKTAADLKQKAYQILAAGEMGIGNTCTAAAIIVSLLFSETDPERNSEKLIMEITGRGAGLDDKRLERKRAVIREAIAKYEFRKKKEDLDPEDYALLVLSSVGGADIAALTGLILGAAEQKLPLILDGVITAAAALCAVCLAPESRAYLLASHKGREQGITAALEELQLHPYINGNMGLGEGTGAIMLLPLLDMSLALYKNGTTFRDIELEAYKEL